MIANFRCPECEKPLARTRHPGDAQWVCVECRSRLVANATIDALARPDVSATLRAACRDPAGRSERDCPGCGVAMARVELSLDGLAVELDHCPRCRLVWFDRGELEQLPWRAGGAAVATRGVLEAESAAATSDAPRAAAREAAWAEAQRDATRGPPRGTVPFEERPRALDAVDAVALAFGLPVVDDDSIAEPRRPAATWIVAFVLLACFLPTAFGERDFAEALGFRAGDAWRSLGATWLSCFLVHASWIHLLSNLWFLVAFGAPVERRLGARGLLLLLAAATLAGNAADAAFEPRRQLLGVGASGGISGVLAALAVLAPSAQVTVRASPYRRFSLFSLFGRFVSDPGEVAASRWLDAQATVSVFWYAAGWFLLQLLGSFAQSAGLGSTSFLAHVGGALAGGAIALVIRIRASAAELSTTAMRAAGRGDRSR